MNYILKSLLALPLTIFCLIGGAGAVEPAGQAKQPLNVLFMIGSSEYNLNETIPAYVKNYLDKTGCKSTMSFTPNQKTRYEKDKADFPGFVKAAADADVIVLVVRRRQITIEAMNAIKSHLNAGKGLVTVRVAVSPFQPIPMHSRSKGKKEPIDPPAGYAKWDQFAKEVLACSYRGHDSKVAFELSIPDDAKDHPILKGVSLEKAAHLYYIAPLLGDAKALLLGTSNSSKATKDGEAGTAHPVVWTNLYGDNKAPIVGLANGISDDFKMNSFHRLLTNALYWAGKQEPPAAVK